MQDDTRAHPVHPSLRARAEALTAGPGRRLLGITGPPGAGKSTLAAGLREVLGDRAAILPMDGFHRPGTWLVAHGMADRKGAPETFDGAAFVAAIAAVRAGAAPGSTPVRLPAFDHMLGEPEPDAIVIGPDVPLVIVEGNYLLLPTPPWRDIRSLLDETWFVDAPTATLEARLVERQRLIHGDEEVARAFVARSDLANARLVSSTRTAADLVVTSMG